MTVLDTSGLVDFLLGTGAGAQVNTLFEQESELAAPDLIVFEVLAVLRREHQRGGLPAERAARAVADLGDTELVLFRTMELREQAWSLHENFRMADALFIVLAMVLEEPFATKDLPLAAAAERGGIDVLRLADASP